MPLAILPSDIFLSLSWIDFVDDTRAAIESRPGIIPFEETKLSKWPDSLLVEDWVLSTQGLAVRSSDSDGIILPPKGYSEWVPFHPEDRPTWAASFGAASIAADPPAPPALPAMSSAVPCCSCGARRLEQLPLPRPVLDARGSW